VIGFLKPKGLALLVRLFFLGLITALLFATGTASATSEGPGRDKLVEALIRLAQTKEKFDLVDIRTTFSIKEPNAKLWIEVGGHRSDIPIASDGSFTPPALAPQQLEEARIFSDPGDAAISTHFEIFFKIPPQPLNYAYLSRAGAQLDQLIEEQAGWKAHLIGRIDRVDFLMQTGGAPCSIILRDATGEETVLRGKDPARMTLKFSSALAAANPTIMTTCPLKDLDPDS